MNDYLVGTMCCGARYDINRAKRNEKRANNLTALAEVGALAVAPYLANKASKSFPIAFGKAEYYTALCMEKGAEYATTFGNKATEYAHMAAGTDVGKTVLSWVDKLKNSKVGSYIGEKAGSLKDKVASNKTVQSFATTVAERFKRFSNSSKLTKGKYALVAAGVGLLAYAGYKVISNYFRKDGAIDQKYQDIERISQIL